jgi:hypothetical protein
MDYKEKIKSLLIKHPKLVIKKYRDSRRPLFGHCYTASEVYYHIEGKEKGFIPYCMKIEEGTHWFLKNPLTGEIIDLTCGKIKYNYGKSYHVPFLTRDPSKRAKIIIKEVI